MTRLFRLPYLYLLFALSAAYALTVRPAAFSGGTVPGVVLGTMSSLQLTCIVWLGCWLLASVLTIPDGTAPSRLLRHGSFGRALLTDTGRSAALLGVAAVVTVTGALLGAAGLPLGAPAASASPSFHPYANAHIPEVAGVIIQVIWLGAALLVVRVLMFTLFLLRPRISTLVVFASAVWVWGTLSVAGPVDLPPFIGPSIYFDAANAIGIVGTLTVPLVAGTLLFTGCAITTRALGRRTFRRVAIPAPWLIYGAAVILSVAVMVAQAKPSAVSLGATVTVVLYGAEGTILQYLVGALIYIGFAYLVLDGFMVARAGWIPLLLLRYGSTMRWFRRWFTRHIGASLFLSVALLVLLGCAYVAEGGQSFTIAPAVVYQVLVNGTLQLVVYVLAVFLAVAVTGSRVAGLVVIGVALVLRPPQAGFGPWVPVQAAATSLVSEAVTVTTALTVTCAAALASSFVLIHRRPTLER
jgi:hypothetical protein